MAKKVINFNTITEKELGQLPGIGRMKATALIEQRTFHSRYSSVNDLISVEGISRSLILKLLEDFSFDFSNDTEHNVITRRQSNIKRQLRKDSQSTYELEPLCSPCKKYKPCGCINTCFCNSNHFECSTGRNSLSISDNVADSGASPRDLQSWLDQFYNWSREGRLIALNDLISGCDMSVVRHMMSKIEPHFQRDFIALLPKELALYVLSFLDPKDLCRAAKTCRYWRILTEDNL